ncbi:SGNH/GDSL hydrolase family protein [Nocardia sp. NPDC004068]|uniref:SGNH/GDSL hydrolase family protein n=1 Tax=Nocardia sp. NPDC004068 TaxID=3364303 RepID=UPI00369E2D6A
MSTSRRLRTVAVAAGLAAAAATGTASAESTTAEPVYVAMGDSYAAGVGIAPVTTVNGVVGLCSQSTVNYPKLVAKALHAKVFRDVSCGGATSADLAGTQPDLTGPAAPQYDALTPDTTLVTIGMGGNDIGLVQLGVSCINPLPEPYGQSCAAANTAGGRDLVGEHIDAFAPTYGTIIEQIRQRSPLARIVLVGYPQGIRENGCPGVQPAWPADATYLQAKIDQLNAVMAAQAAAHDATFVSLTASTRGHDACAAPGQSWMVGAVPTSPDAVVPLHPNAASHANTARQVLAALDR